MYVKDTIAAIVTPPGIGGIGVIRLSGPAAVEIAELIFVAKGRLARPLSHHLRHGLVVDEHGDPIDEVLAACMYAPHSYTGEDVVEIHCHGSPILLAAVLQRCVECGSRPADPGEFTKRAFLNGRLDLVQAEAVGELVAARTAAAARTGMRHLEGGLSAELAKVRAALLAVRARTEAMIDFSEEDLGDLDIDQLREGIGDAEARIDALLRSFRRGRLLRQGAHLVLLGRPNVGKSSLLNALLGRDRAIVTPVPGTTRDVIAESLEICGIPVVIADTAGLRADADELEQFGIERTRREAASADGVLLVLDRAMPLHEDDRRALGSIGDTPAIVAVNKCDLAPLWDPALQEDVRRRRWVEISAVTSAGLDRLRAAIVELLGGEEIDVDAPLVTLTRHRDALRRALEALGLARESLERSAAIDLVAVDIQAAVEHIGSITGEVTTEEVLDRIFSEFCIGK